MNEIEEIKKQAIENSIMLREVHAKLDRLSDAIQDKAVLTSQEAADYLGISRMTLSKRRDNGEIPYHMAGSHFRYRIKDLENYLLTKGA